MLESSSESDLSSLSKAVTAIVPYSKGFVCSCGPGKVFVFEKTDDRDLYKNSREVNVCTIISYKLLLNFIL